MHKKIKSIYTNIIDTDSLKWSPMIFVYAGINNTWKSYSPEEWAKKLLVELIEDAFKNKTNIHNNAGEKAVYCTGFDFAHRQE